MSRAREVPRRYDPSYTAFAMRAGKMKSRTNSFWTFSTYTFEAPVFFALARTGLSSSP